MQWLNSNAALYIAISQMWKWYDYRSHCCKVIRDQENIDCKTNAAMQIGLCMMQTVRGLKSYIFLKKL